VPPLPGRQRALLGAAGPCGGIKLFSAGVMVSACRTITKTDRNTRRRVRTGKETSHHITARMVTPSSRCGLCLGCCGEKMSIRVIREDKQVQLTAQAV
jgi:hypothetical protein